MVQVTLRLSVAADRAHLLIEALTSHGVRAKRCVGCQSAHVLTDVTEAGAFWYCEEWMDEPALEEQLRSDHFSQLLALMEISARPPVLEFRMFERARGLDYVAAVRDADE
jgi:quinol monooxygenase YgiN